MEVKKLYLFNPFTIETSTEQEIADTYTELMNRLFEEQDTPGQIAHNIEIYSNLMFLCGEMTARITEQYDLVKTDKDIKEDQAIYTYRNRWVEENEEKPPAIAYFESMAKQTVIKQYEELAYLGAKLTRFKKAYESLEQKMNALKKKLEAIKYEI